MTKTTIDKRNIFKATTEQLERWQDELTMLDDTPEGLTDEEFGTLCEVEKELDRRAYDDEDPWAPQNHHD